MSCSCHVKNRNLLNVKPIGLSLYRLHYPGPWSAPRYDAALLNAMLEGLQQMNELDKDV